MVNILWLVRVLCDGIPVSPQCQCACLSEFTLEETFIGTVYKYSETALYGPMREHKHAYTRLTRKTGTSNTHRATSVHR